MEIEYYTLEEINVRWLERTQEISALASQALATLAHFVEEFLERVRLWWEEFCRQMRAILAPFFESLDKVYEELQRTSFYIRLCEWHLPHWLAEPVVRYWPRAWLPNPPISLFDK